MRITRDTPFGNPYEMTVEEKKSTRLDRTKRVLDKMWYLFHQEGENFLSPEDRATATKFYANRHNLTGQRYLQLLREIAHTDPVTWICNPQCNKMVRQGHEYFCHRAILLEIIYLNQLEQENCIWWLCQYTGIPWE